MRYLVLVCCGIMISYVGRTQAQDVWLRYDDKKARLWGYEDLKGRVRTPPRFHMLTAADSFYNIIAVDDAKSGDSYYLLKNGRQVGRDSLYSFDFTYDCESEGKILFRNHATMLVGFFDKEGRVAIPAVYNYASPFHNGYSLALRNAQRKQYGEHWGWEGGEMVLINASNEILAEKLGPLDADNINWYTSRQNDPSVDTGISVFIKGRQGIVYSFTDFEKEFRRWFGDDFLPAIGSGNPADMKRVLYPSITYWSEKRGWVSRPADQFIKSFPAVLSRDRFRESEVKRREISPAGLGLNNYIFDAPVYRKYFDACGEHNKSLYPLFEVVLSYYKKRPTPIPEASNSRYSAFQRAFELDYQDHFEFLRTEQGYRLISVSAKR